MLGLSVVYVTDLLLLILDLSVFFLRSASSGSLGSGRSRAIALLDRSVPRFEVSRTGGAGGFSSSEDMATTNKDKCYRQSGRHRQIFLIMIATPDLWFQEEDRQYLNTIESSVDTCTKI